MNPADEIIDYARRFIGLPYIYGGNNPLGGFDCSGFICFVLRKYGLVGPHEDLSAQGIYEKIKKGSTIFAVGSSIYPRAALVFYGDSTSLIGHISMIVDKHSVIEAGGGNPRTDCIEKAKLLNACVRETSLRFRSDIVAVILPTYPS